MEGVEIEGTRIFEKLGPDSQEELLSSLIEKEFAPGTTIITEGQANNTFYVIKSGVAKVIQNQQGAAPRELAQLTNGGFFGERALLQDEPARVNVAVGDAGLVCFTLDRTAFNKVFGGTMLSLLKSISKKREEEANRPERPKFVDLELRRILGVGTFGRVKLVVHKPTGVTYALKCMRKAQVVATKQQSHVRCSHQKPIQPNRPPCTASADPRWPSPSSLCLVVVVVVVSGAQREEDPRDDGTSLHPRARADVPGRR